TDARQVRLLEYLQQRFDHVGFERVCSGIGMPNIYEYLRDEEKLPERPDVLQSIASAKDRTKAIIDAAFDPRHPCGLCRATPPPRPRPPRIAQRPSSTPPSPRGTPAACAGPRSTRSSRFSRAKRAISR